MFNRTRTERNITTGKYGTARKIEEGGSWLYIVVVVRVVVRERGNKKRERAARQYQR